MQAFGRPLFTVHREPCAATIHGVMRFLGGVSAIGARQIAQKKVPSLLKFTDGAVRALRGR